MFCSSGGIATYIRCGCGCVCTMTTPSTTVYVLLGPDSHKAIARQHKHFWHEKFIAALEKGWQETLWERYLRLCSRVRWSVVSKNHTNMTNDYGNMFRQCSKGDWVAPAAPAGNTFTTYNASPHDYLISLGLRRSYLNEFPIDTARARAQALVSSQTTEGRTPEIDWKFICK